MSSSSDSREESDMDYGSEYDEWESSTDDANVQTVSEEEQQLSLEIEASGPETAVSEAESSELDAVNDQFPTSGPYEPIHSQEPPLYEGDFSPEIRLLVLRPSKIFQDELQASLETFRLSDAPTYIALSYEWKGPRIDCEENLDLRLPYDTLSLEPNLAHALRCFRKNINEPACLWVDAVCINQANLRECGQQVQIMSDIYRNADGVWIWLGPSTRDSDLAMRVIEEAKDYPEEMKGEYSRPMKWVKRVLNHPEYRAKRIALYLLFHRTYWRRLWIVQEVVLGACTNVPKLYCGGRVSAFGHIFKLAKGIRAVAQMSSTSNTENGMMTEKLNRAAGVIINLANHIEENSVSPRKNPKSKLLSLLKRYNGNICTNPRDKVYALLGIANQEGPGLQVDYSISLTEVCIRTAKHIILASKRLDLLAACFWQEESAGEDANRAKESGTSSQPATSNLLEIVTPALESVEPAIPQKAPRPLKGIPIPNRVSHGPSWVPRWGQDLGPRLYPATEFYPKDLRTAVSRDWGVKINPDNTITAGAIFCGSVVESMPVWIPGTPMTEQEHLQRLLQTLHRLRISQIKTPDFYSPDMSLERATAQLLYRILFLSEPNQHKSGRHADVNVQSFISWAACFLRGLVPSVEPSVSFRDFVEQPQRFLFLYRTSQISKNHWKIDHLVPHGFGLSLAHVQQNDEVVIPQTCKYVMLVRKYNLDDPTSSKPRDDYIPATRNGYVPTSRNYYGPTPRDNYVVLGQCYASRLSAKFRRQDTGFTEKGPDREDSSEYYSGPDGPSLNEMFRTITLH